MQKQNKSHIILLVFVFFPNTVASETCDRMFDLVRDKHHQQSRQRINDLKCKGDRPSLIPNNLFVAWSRDSDHKSIHYLSTEVQGSSTSWLDQACKWCMHFPVQIYKTDIQLLQKLEQWKQRSAVSQMDIELHDSFCVSCRPWVKKKSHCFPQPGLVNKYLITSREDPFCSLVSKCSPQEVTVQ